jgi:hypothetical protein
MHLFEKPRGAQTRWASFENPTAARGSGARENRGAKGHAFDSLEPGETKTLLAIDGCGTVRRLWLTVSDRSPAMLRGLRLEAFWDGAETPAVSVPLGDFFGIGLGRRTPFECALFSDPEGRSFNACVPMPFRTAARITLTNDTPRRLPHLFYDVDLTLEPEHSPETLYLHAVWRRESPNALGENFVLLPRVPGSGRFLGVNVGVIADARYDGAWWGEGEVKVWFGDESDPSLCGTGTEDYIGTGWGQGAYAQRTQGCPIADAARRQWAFYRYHVDDPIYFDDGCTVAIQTIGGTGKAQTQSLRAQRVPLIPVSIDTGQQDGFHNLMDRPQPVDLADPTVPDGWCNFWRQDDWSATAYVYLDRPDGLFGPLPDAATRSAGLEPVDGTDTRADL